MIQRACLVCLGIASLFLVQGQESYSYFNTEREATQLEEFGKHDLYGLILNRTEALHDFSYDPFKEALASNNINEKRSIDLLLEQAMFAESLEDKNLYNALVSLKYFDQNEFGMASDYAQHVNSSMLKKPLREELEFKTGYAFFVKKNFEQADPYFDYSNDSYREPSIYYGAMTKYFLNDRKSAIKGFERIDNTYPYNEYVPYYLTQIYFADKDFGNVVEYGKKCLRNKNLENKNQIHKLIGLSNFELGNYTEANEHLAIYANETPKLTKEEFYQIAYSQYQIGMFEESIANFKEISNIHDTIGHLANYYIADTYLKQGDHKAAQTAFGKVAKINTLPDLQADASFNYALLSAQLGEERLAINTLSSIPKGHIHYEQSQNLMSQVLRNTKDYKAAMAVIEALPEKNDNLLEVFQELAYKQAIQNFNDETPLKALSYLTITEETPGLASLKAESIFWQALIHHEDDNQLRSQALLDKYFKFTQENPSSKKANIEANANYLQAYKYWNKKDYDQALPYFKKSTDSNSNLDNAKMADAFVRIGDAHFLENDYSNANKNYESAIRKNPQNDYPAYQLGMVAGLQKGPIDKIVLLEDFNTAFAESPYRDDALFEIGNAYYSLGKKNDALIAFDQLLEDYGEESPLARKTLLRKGLISYNAGDIKAAVNSYRRIFGLSPSAEEKKEALIALEEIYISELNDPQGYFELAESEGGVKLNDMQKDSLSYAIANDQFKNGDYQKAAYNFERYCDQFPKGLYYLTALYNQGESYSLLKEYGQAASQYEKVISLGKTDYYLKALKKTALIKYNHEQDFAGAYGYYDKLIQEEKQNELDFIEAALVCANKSENDEGVIKYANLLNQNRTASNDQKSIAYFYLAKASQKQGQIDQAIAAYNKVVQMSKNAKAAEASYLIAQLFYDKDNWATSEAQALETTQRASNYPFWVAKSLILLTRIYVDKKDVYNAKAAIEAVLENYTDDPQIISEANAMKIEVDALEAAENRVIEPSDTETLLLDTLNTSK